MTQDELNDMASKDYNLFVQYMAELITQQQGVISRQANIIILCSGYMKAEYEAVGVAAFVPELWRAELMGSVINQSYQEFNSRWDLIYQSLISQNGDDDNG